MIEIIILVISKVYMFPYDIFNMLVKPFARRNFEINKLLLESALIYSNTS